MGKFDWCAVIEKQWCNLWKRQNVLSLQWGSASLYFRTNLVFNLCFVNDFNKCLNKSDAIMYADNTSIFLLHHHIDNLYTNAQIEMNLISNWLAANKLTLNVGGTKYPT